MKHTDPFGSRENKTSSITIVLARQMRTLVDFPSEQHSPTASTVIYRILHQGVQANEVVDITIPLISLVPNNLGVVFPLQ